MTGASHSRSCNGLEVPSYYRWSSSGSGEGKSVTANPLEKAVLLEEDRPGLRALIASLGAELGETQQAMILDAARRRGLVGVGTRALKYSPFVDLPLVYLSEAGKAYVAGLARKGSQERHR